MFSKKILFVLPAVFGLVFCGQSPTSSSSSSSTLSTSSQASSASSSLPSSSSSLTSSQSSPSSSSIQSYSSSASMKPSPQPITSISISGPAKSVKDLMLGDESKNYFQTIPFHHSSRLSTLGSAIENDFFKKSASEYWPKSSPSSSSSSQMLHEQNVFASSPSASASPSSPAGLVASPSYNHIGMVNVLPSQEYHVNQGYLTDKEINVHAEHKPIMLHYRTHAQPIVVHQTRIPGPKPEVKHTTSHEEPQRVVHEVIRPIIQEVHEIIQPYRRVVQQVQPVIEEVRTIIAKDANSGDGPAKASLPVANHLASSNAGNDHRSLMSGHNQHSLLVNAGSGHGYGHSSGLGSYNGGPNKGPLYASASVSDLRHVASKPSSSTSSSNLNNAFDRKSMLENENLLSLPNNQRLVRSKVYITRKGVPVYQSNYRAPVYFTI